MACFVQAAYLLELDRQERIAAEKALAPNWWLPFKYKLSRTLRDRRDGSIFGAILEWERSVTQPIRPSGAPRAVLAIRGTLFNIKNIRMDLTDDLRFAAWESLTGSVRFKIALDAMKSLVKNFGSSDVCIAGHSLGAGFAFQIGKLLAADGIIVEAHLYNPPSISVARSIINIREDVVSMFKGLAAKLPFGTSSRDTSVVDPNTAAAPNNRWIPHLYVNHCDYVCCLYTAGPTNGNKEKNKKVAAPASSTNVVVKLFITYKNNQKFFDAHALKQWWADDFTLKNFADNSPLINRQLKSLYQLPRRLK
ncbi:hypothetical protein RND81_12G231900 [Saponaria officinalis]|uniref:Uncharacterized protein n=1 Tax=Saponaria officinalis TaxID=3572 RepID=A0AAW1HEF0_SAPOF